jgi:hypothetical protein
MIGTHPSPAAAGGVDPVVDGITPGTVPTLFGGMGTVDMTNQRTRALEQNNPWAALPVPLLLRKLTHFRAPGLGDAMWSGQCVYDVSGVSEAFSEYDQDDFYASDDDLRYSVTAGVVKSSDQLTVGELTTTRRSRVAAHYDSAPASQHFQGYWNPHWSGLLAGFVKTTPRPLFNNFNPNQQGSKELHKATQYNPVPPMGSLVSYYGTTNEKAL